MTTQARTAGDVWDRMIVGWHAAFFLALAVAETYLLTTPDLRGHRLAATGLLAVLAATYAATVMRQGPRPQEGPGATLYLLVAVVVTGLSCALDPFLSLLLFVVYPQVWLLSADVRRGVATTALLTAASTAGFGAFYDWAPGVLAAVVPQMLVSMGFSVGLGIWISRVIDQSRERGELLAQLEQTREELAAAHRAQGVVAERERVAREIHDTLAQGFTSVVMLAQAASGRLARDRDGSSRTADVDRAVALARLAAIEQVARDNLAEARALVAAFAPPGLDGATLSAALRRLTERFALETGLRVDVELSGALAPLSREQEVVLLRAAQEALTNVRRHARAQRVVVRLVADTVGARVEIGDDGIGLSPRVGEGFGLAGMRGRVTEAGGELNVASSPGTGTTVTVRLPSVLGTA